MNNVYEVPRPNAAGDILRQAWADGYTKTFCPACDIGHKVQLDDDGYFHALEHDDPPCANYDTEWVHFLEPLGKPHYAWLPRRCRNGAIRWLVWLEHHKDGTYTQPMEPL